MSDRPAEIDLVVPYFGDRTLLEECVHSVLAQDRPDWRLTIVEDGDQHHDVATWLAALDDPRIIHVLNPSTLGIAGNFQRCLDLASAEYVAFLGCDDRLLPDYVTTVLGLARTFPIADALLPGVRLIDAEGRPFRTAADSVKSWLRPSPAQPRQLSGELLLTSLLHGNWSYFPATCWRRRTIARLGFRSDLPVTLDLDLLTRVVLLRGSVALTSHEAFEYRRHRDSASSRAAADSGRFREEARLFAEIARACHRRGWSRAARAARWHLTSRAHAALRLPGSLASRDCRAARMLVRHVVGR